MVVQLLPFLVLLLVFGIPIVFGVRWAVKRYEAVAGARSTEFPTYEEFAALVDRMEALDRRLEDLDGRQLFLERLLEEPKAPREAAAARTPGGDETD